MTGDYCPDIFLSCKKYPYRCCKICPDYDACKQSIRCANPDTLDYCWMKYSLNKQEVAFRAIFFNWKGEKDDE